MSKIPIDNLKEILSCLETDGCINNLMDTSEGEVFAKGWYVKKYFEINNLDKIEDNLYYYFPDSDNWNINKEVSLIIIKAAIIEFSEEFVENQPNYPYYKGEKNKHCRFWGI